MKEEKWFYSYIFDVLSNSLLYDTNCLRKCPTFNKKPLIPFISKYYHPSTVQFLDILKCVLPRIIIY